MLASALAVLTVLAVVPSCGGGDGAPRHLVLVTLDTVRADRVGALGGRPGATPRIDALAAEGTLFTDAWTPRGQTWPALASLLSGRHPLVHGVRENGFALPSAVPTLAEALRHAGFRTGAFLSNACEAWGAERFDRLACTQTAEERAGDQSRAQHAWDERAVDEALAWLDAGGRRSFAWVHLYDAHKPFPTIDALRERFLDPAYQGSFRATPGERASRHAMAFHERVDAAALAGRVPAPPEMEALLAYYDAGLFGVDRNVGRLVDGLAARGLLEDTLLVVTADHGEELFDHHAYPYHGAALHGTTLRVPLVVRDPRAPGPRRVDERVSLLDVAPTLYDALDVPPPGPLDGVSLWPLVRGDAQVETAEREHLSELVELDVEALPPRLGGEVFALQRGAWRLVWNPERVRVTKPPYEAGAGIVHETALYRLDEDPLERVDRAAENPDVVEALRRALEARVARLRAEARPQTLPSPEVIETLRSLGYLGD